MYKKIILLVCLIIGAGIAGILAANNKGFDNKVTIQFSSWGSESEIRILKPLIYEFERENPDIKVDFMHIPQNYFQKLHLLFASNTAPDVVFINNQYIPVYANAGVLDDLTSDSEYFGFKNFYKKSIEALSYKGKIYAVPRDISNLVIYYNRDIFDKYNVPYPSENWTYDEFLQTAQKLTHRPQLFGISFDEEPLFYLPYLMSFGLKSVPDFNNPQTRKGLEIYAQLRNKYYVAPKKEEAASATMAQLFLQEKLAMQLSGRWLVPKYRTDAKFNWDIAPFPKGAAGSVVPVDASGWAIAKSSKHKNEAKKLIKFLSSQNSSAEFAKSGLIVPARIDTAKSDAFLDGKPPAHALYFIKTAEKSPATPVTINYREITDELKSQTEGLFNR